MLVLGVFAYPLSAECPSRPAGTFPAIETENVARDSLTLPADVATSGSIFIISFRREDSDASTNWDKMLAESNSANTLDYYVMPVIDNPGKIIQGFIRGGLRSNLNKEQQKRFILLFTDTEEFRRALGMQTDELQVLVVNKGGKVTHAECGAPTAEKISTLIEKVQ